ncbi:unnamed protein product [Gadus morhua 'NCC']
MERCSISPVKRLTAHRCLLTLLLVAAAAPPSSGNRDDTNRVGARDERADALYVPGLSVTAQATPTPLWAVVWGPTHPPEDETHHFLSSQDPDLLHQPGDPRAGGGSTTATAQFWPFPQDVVSSSQTRGEPALEARHPGGPDAGGAQAEEREAEEVDPQFYVTVTISSLLIFTAVVITAKLCYDRSCSQHPPPLSRAAAPPLTLALPRSLAPEDSRQTLHSPPFTDRERIPVVNL